MKPKKRKDIKMNKPEVKQLKDIEYEIKLHNERITAVIGFILLCIIIF